jgi:protein O-mannosyl-transferase
MNTPFANNGNSSLYKMAFLIMTTLILYANTLGNQFALDDTGVILKNRFYIEHTTLAEVLTTNYRFGANEPRDGLYRPIAMLSFLANHAITGFHPLSYHAVNILIHTSTVLMIFLLFTLLTGKQTISFIGALLFAAHPIHTEAVANIAGRPELLMTFFALLSWLILEQKIPRLYKYPTAALCLMLALLSKETAAVLPFMVSSIDIVKQNHPPVKEILRKFIILSSVVAVYLIIRWLVLGDTATGNVPRYHDNPLYYMPFLSRVMNAIFIQGKYLILLLVPWRLLSDYSFSTFPLVTSAWSWNACYTLSAIVLFIIGAIYVARKNNTYLIGIILFIPPSLLVSNIFFPIGTIMGERLMYLPSAGILLALATGFEEIRRRYSMFSYSILFIVISFYAIRTIDRNSDWHDDRSLTLADFKKAPDNLKLLNNMAVFARNDGDLRTAIIYYSRGITIYPCFSEGMTGLAGIALDRSDTTSAMAYYQNASECAPNDQIVQFNYASILIQRGQLHAAEEILNKALSVIPDAPLLYRGLGNLQLTQMHYRDAIPYYENALASGDNPLICYTNLIIASYSAGLYDRAWRYVQEASTRRVIIEPELVREVQNVMMSR